MDDTTPTTNAYPLLVTDVWPETPDDLAFYEECRQATRCTTEMLAQRSKPPKKT